MKLRSDQTLKKEDINMLSLRQLYEHFGYVHYKMNKFEEYDLYAENKDFLAGDKIITFTDTNGKLLALKPDVTLSIVKNYNDIPGVVRKVYYNENIYRTSKSTKTYKEIMQMGLECIGDLDIYQIAEVLILAAASLASPSAEGHRRQPKDRRRRQTHQHCRPHRPMLQRPKPHRARPQTRKRLRPHNLPKAATSWMCLTWGLSAAFWKSSA
mgnify:CR=1 FL=1